MGQLCRRIGGKICYPCEICNEWLSFALFGMNMHGARMRRCVACRARKSESPRERRRQENRWKALVRATPQWVDAEALRVIYETAIRQRLTVDHIVPLRNALVCGLHVPWNLQILTTEANAEKGNHFNETEA